MPAGYQHIVFGNVLDIYNIYIRNTGITVFCYFIIYRAKTLEDRRNESSDKSHELKTERRVIGAVDL